MPMLVVESLRKRSHDLHTAVKEPSIHFGCAHFGIDLKRCSFGCRADIRIKNANNEWHFEDATLHQDFFELCFTKTRLFCAHVPAKRQKIET